MDSSVAKVPLRQHRDANRPKQKSLWTFSRLFFKIPLKTKIWLMKTRWTTNKWAFRLNLWTLPQACRFSTLRDSLWIKRNFSRGSVSSFASSIKPRNQRRICVKLICLKEICLFKPGKTICLCKNRLLEKWRWTWEILIRETLGRRGWFQTTSVPALIRSHLWV